MIVSTSCPSNTYVADNEGAENDSNDEDKASRPTLQKRKKVQKSSLAEAFKSIMNKKIEEVPEDQAGLVQQHEPILAKYKKRSREVEEERKAADELSKKRALKEKQRLMGRIIPTKLDNEHEREL